MTCTHKAMLPGESEKVTNRMCMECGAHWHGKTGEVKEYTARAWNLWVSFLPDLDV